MQQHQCNDSLQTLSSWIHSQKEAPKINVIKGGYKMEVAGQRTNTGPFCVNALLNTKICK